MNKLIKSLGIAGAGLLMVAGVALAATTVVTPTNMQGWGFAPENTAGTQSGQMVVGPSNPPLGDGSARLKVNNANEGMVLAKSAYQGLRFDEIENLHYSTYRSTGGSALAIALQFDLDNNVEDSDNGFKGRIVYEPYHTQTVQTGVWQIWDTLNDSAGIGTGNWWLTNGAQAAFSGCAQANPCTWAEIEAKYPNGGIRNTANPNVWLKAGSGWVGFDGNVDALVINDDTYNFEVTNVPTDKEQCKKDGYMDLTDSSGNTFKNQGQCVSYFNQQ